MKPSTIVAIRVTRLVDMSRSTPPYPPRTMCHGDDGTIFAFDQIHVQQMTKMVDYGSTNILLQPLPSGRQCNCPAIPR